MAFRGDDAAAVKRALTFAGFLKVAPCPEDARVLTAERAAWEAGASAPVRLSFGKPAAAAAATSTGNGSVVAVKNGSQNGAVASTNGNGAPPAAKKTWKLALDDDDEDGGGGGGDDDLVDEDALLESSAPVKRASEAVSEPAGPLAGTAATVIDSCFSLSCSDAIKLSFRVCPVVVSHVCA